MFLAVYIDIRHPARHHRAMNRADRLFALHTQLHDGALHRAEDLAKSLAVSVRTIYRDVATLAAAGIPVSGTRGSGYSLADRITLPPLSLTRAEAEALNLGIAIVAESDDPDLHAAAAALAAKIDAALPVDSAPSPVWNAAHHPQASAARGFSHMAVLQSAIRGRQKLRLTPVGQNPVIVRPLRVENWARLWVLTAWNESSAGFERFRTDMLLAATALPELFVDEPGKRLADFDPYTGR